MPEDEKPEAQFGLVMPFVVCEDHGGPYDAASFVAGYEASFIDQMLGTIKAAGGSFERWVPPELVPQIDLIAMKHGYGVESEPCDEHPDEWVRVSFSPPGSESDDA